MTRGSWPPASPLGVGKPSVTVQKSATGDCCAGWVGHLRTHGYAVTTEDVADLVPIKQKLGVPRALQSCHTAQVDGYVIEGHVPADLGDHLLSERPQIAALPYPGCPSVLRAWKRRVHAPAQPGPGLWPIHTLHRVRHGLIATLTAIRGVAAITAVPAVVVLGLLLGPSSSVSRCAAADDETRISPDRPTVSNNADTIPPRAVQIEAGLVYRQEQLAARSTARRFAGEGYPPDRAPRSRSRCGSSVNRTWPCKARRIRPVRATSGSV